MSNAQSEELRVESGVSLSAVLKPDMMTRTEELAVQMESQISQLAMMISQLNARLAAMEDDGKVTILHQDALKLGQLIKARARVLADKYQLGPAGERRIRAAIKKAVLSQYGIRDLHDLPARRLAAARMLIEGWSSYQAIREASLCG